MFRVQHFCYLSVVCYAVFLFFFSKFFPHVLLLTAQEKAKIAESRSHYTHQALSFPKYSEIH